MEHPLGDVTHLLPGLAARDFQPENELSEVVYAALVATRTVTRDCIAKAWLYGELKSARPS